MMDNADAPRSEDRSQMDRPGRSTASGFDMRIVAITANTTKTKSAQSALDSLNQLSTLCRAVQAGHQTALSDLETQP